MNEYLPMIKLSKPYIPDSSIKLAVQSLNSGDLVQGKYVQIFEERLSEYLETDYTVIVSSGTAALHLSLVALGIKPGDEVIIPAFTFPATANVVELVGAKPIFVDIALDDYCIDITKIEEHITNKTKAIIPVHEFGQSSEIDKIIDIAKKYSLYVIEDAACAIGTEYKGKKAGTFGDIGCFSFHPRKILTTGEGGAIVTNNKLLAEKIKCLRNHGIQNIDGKNNFIAAGFNYRITDFQATLAIPQLEVIDETLECHKTQAWLYNKQFSNISSITIPRIFPERYCTYQTYHILFTEPYIRDYVIEQLKKYNVETNIGAQALQMLKFYIEKYNYPKDLFKNAAIAFEQGLALPIGRHLRSDDIKRITDKIINILKNEI